MDGSGLKELLCLIYAGNSVDHILTGHAFSRAIRAHLLVYCALGTIIAKRADDIDNQQHADIRELLKEFALQPPTLEEINENEKLEKITEKMTDILADLKSQGRTAKLWLQYFNCITIMMQFIEAERLGNWELHLQCVRDMLPIFHAAGHLPYAKSAQIYLQDMLNLPNVMDPEEYRKFTTEGYFTIRRSDKKWAGIWTDMTIEQTLNRLMKIFGGLTHGRGINKEGVVARWTATMPIAFEIMEAFETFCRVRAESAEQHKDWRPTSIKRDTDDYLKLVNWLTLHDPFADTNNSALMCIADGLCAGDDVNCDEAVEIGLKAMQSMIGVNAADMKLKRSTKVKSIATTKRGVVIDNEVTVVNTTLLFQRIAAVIKDDSDLATEALHYELAPFPLSLFDEQGIMRKAKKAELYNIFTSKPVTTIDLAQHKLVLDGGFLLHKVIWPLGSTYQQVLQMYQDYILKHYGSSAVVVFDGYEQIELGTKSYERFRRSKSNKSTEIKFEKEMTISVSQSCFLSNDKNKHRLINFLKLQLTSVGIAVKQAAEDADRLIATTAIELLTGHPKVAVIGEDVDLLVLLIALTPVDQDISFIKRGSGKVATVVYSTQQHQHLKEIILFNHAFTGCDTTSAIYLKGKKKFFNTLKKKPKLLEHVAVFNNSDSTKTEIKHAGERLMLALCGAEENATCINTFRYERFLTSAARFKTEIRLAQLPPSAGATEQHVWRVYFQVQKWLGNNQLDPRGWGWEEKNQVFFPVMTNVPPAPQGILRMIHCTCKGNCSNRCGCRKAGLNCSSICSGCHGILCLNCPEVDLSCDHTDDSNDLTDTEILLNNFNSLMDKHMDGIISDEEDAEEDDQVSSQDEPSTSKKQRVT